MCRIVGDKTHAKQADIVWQTVLIFLVKHACAFGHHEKHCHFQNMFRLSQGKNVYRAHVCGVAKPTNIVLDKQNFKCWLNNVCPFD